MAQFFKLTDLEITSVTINQDGTFHGTWEPGRIVVSDPTNERWITPNQVRRVQTKVDHRSTGVKTRAVNLVLNPKGPDTVAVRIVGNAVLSHGNNFELGSLMAALQDPRFRGAYRCLRGGSEYLLGVLDEVVEALTQQPAG